MHRIIWVVVLAAVACGGKKDPDSKKTGSAETPKPKEPDPEKPKTGSGRSLGELTAGSGSAAPPIDVAPPPKRVIKQVAGDCNWKIADVAQAAVCEYRCTLDERDACTLAARKYFDGDGVRADRARALELATRACDLEAPDGCTLAAGIDAADLKKGEAYAAKALPLYERDCVAEIATACLQLGLMLERSDQKRSVAEYKKGFDLQRKACDGGEGAQCALLAAAHETGGRGLPKDVMFAADLRKKACEQNHATTCFELSKEASKDDKRSALVEKACTLGLRAACGKLALELAGQNTIRSAQISQRACLLGELDACIRQGEDHAKRNEKEKALEMFKRACELGNERGCGQARALGAK